jgi:hypothetical protein
MILRLIVEVSADEKFEEKVYRRYGEALRSISLDLFQGCSTNTSGYVKDAV